MSARNSIASLSSGSTKVETRLVNVPSRTSLCSHVSGQEGAMIPSSSSKDDDLLSSSSDEIEKVAMSTLEHMDETKSSAMLNHQLDDKKENPNEDDRGSEKLKETDEPKANIQNEFGVCGWILTILSYLLIFVTLPISACMCIKVVQEYERAVIFRLGRLMPGGAKGPGIFFIVPCIDTYRKVDLRVLSFEVPPQEILSKDSVTVAVDAVVYFRISNATISVTNVEDAARSTKLLAQTTLRNILGTKTLAEMLSDREAISHQMQTTLDEATEPWGVKVERVEVKDVRLPVQLQRAMAAEAEAAREARAKVIVAEGEQKASRALKEAAEVIAESPSALQLRYLQTLNSISAEKNSTIIFPFPIDLLSAFLQRPAPKVEEPPPLPKKIRSCCLYKYPEWVQGLVGSETKQPAQLQSQVHHSHLVGASGPNTTITSGRPPLPYSIREAQQHSPTLHMQTSGAPLQLDPGSLSDATRPPTWRDMRSQSGGGATNSLLKKAIANRLKPTVTGDKQRLPTDRSQTNESDTSPKPESDSSGTSVFCTRRVNMESLAKKDVPTISENEEVKATSRNLEKGGALASQLKKSMEEDVKKGSDPISQRIGPAEQGQSQRSEQMKSTDHKAGGNAQKAWDKLPSGEAASLLEQDGSSNQKQELDVLAPKGKSSSIDKVAAPMEAQHRSFSTSHPESSSARQGKIGSPSASPKPPAKRRTPQPTRLETPHGNSVALNLDENQKRPRHRSRGAEDDERRDSTISESSRVSFSSHKSVTFSDRVQMHEIERNEVSSSGEDAAIMSDDELTKHPLERHRRSTSSHQNAPQGGQMGDLYSLQDDDHMMFEALEQPVMLLDMERSDVHASGYQSEQPADIHSTERRGSDSSQFSAFGDKTSPTPIHSHNRFAEMRSTGVQATEVFNGSYPQYYQGMDVSANLEAHGFPRSASGYFEEEDSDEEEVQQSYPHLLHPGEDVYTLGDSPVFFPGRRGPRADNLIEISAYDNSSSPIPTDDEDELREEPLRQLQLGGTRLNIPQNQHGTPQGASAVQTSPNPQHFMQPRASLPVLVMGNGREAERSDIEEEMRRQFLRRFGAGRRAPVAEEDPCDPVHSMGSSDSVALSGSRESVVSAVSIAKEAATHRNFNY